MQPGRLALSSLASESSSELPRSPPPRSRHKRSNALLIDREELAKLNRLLKSPPGMRPRDIPETAVDDSSISESLAEGKAAQPSLSRSHVRFAVPSNARPRGTESGQGSNNNTEWRHRNESGGEAVQAQRAPDPGTPEREAFDAQEPEEDMTEDDRIRLYALNATPQPDARRPMYKVFPTPTRDQAQLAEYLKNFDEQDIYAPHRRRRDEEIDDMRRSLLAERQPQDGELYALGPAGGRAIRLIETQRKEAQAQEADHTTRPQPAQQHTAGAAPQIHPHASDDHIRSAVD
ncbi:hypothetical protein BST61_g5389 [Cercospora zeina]